MRLGGDAVPDVFHELNALCYAQLQKIGKMIRLHAPTVPKPAGPNKSAAQPQPYTIAKRDRTRWWEVRDAAGELVCLTVYRRGAREVVRRLSVATA
jgi:hypothetical protein